MLVVHGLDPLLSLLLLLLLDPHSLEGGHPPQRRFEYKLSFKGPRLALPGAGIPFWSHHGGEGPAMPRVPQNAGAADQLWVAVTWWGMGLPVIASAQDGARTGTDSARGPRTFPRPVSHSTTTPASSTSLSFYSLPLPFYALGLLSSLFPLLVGSPPTLPL